MFFFVEFHSRGNVMWLQSLVSEILKRRLCLIRGVRFTVIGCNCLCFSCPYMTNHDDSFRSRLLEDEGVGS